jgi:hypothetical protein
MKSNRHFAATTLGLASLFAAGAPAFADHDNHWHGGNVRVQRTYYYGAQPRYGSGWYRPWYRPWPGPAVSFTYVSRPAAYYYDDYGTVYRGRSVTVDVQVALAKRGYYHGPIDGDIGPGSRAAIRAYQVDRGLPVTGRIDQNLLRALRL